jgi:hypothetical protein
MFLFKFVIHFVKLKTITHCYIYVCHTFHQGESYATQLYLSPTKGHERPIISCHPRTDYLIRHLSSQIRQLYNNNPLARLSDKIINQLSQRPDLWKNQLPSGITGKSNYLIPAPSILIKPEGIRVEFHQAEGYTILLHLTLSYISYHSVQIYEKTNYHPDHISQHLNQIS